MTPPQDPEFDERKTETVAPQLGKCPIERRPDGSVTINSYALASQILRSGGLRQAGFNARLVEQFPQKNTSVLFKEGDDHRVHRIASARFFAPKAVTGRYRTLMTDLSEKLVAKLKREKTAVLDEMSLEMSTAVGAEIVGLTESILPGLGRRLSRMFETEAPASHGWFATAGYIARAQFNLLLVYLFDVAPALRKRRRERRNDLISHLLDQKYSLLDLLTECVTYSTAGISTTREFLVVVVWHLLERDDLRRRFLDANEAGQLAMVEEILRLEPPVGVILRRTETTITLDNQGRKEEIAPDTVVAIDVRGTNADESAVGGCPHKLDPARAGGKIAAHMSFGDGHHKCPGAPVALQETAIFLNHLLRVPGIRLVNPPEMTWNTMTMGYVLRGARIAVD